MRDGRYSQAAERDETRWDEMRWGEECDEVSSTTTFTCENWCGIDRSVAAAAVNQTLMSTVRGGRVGCI